MTVRDILKLVVDGDADLDTEVKIFEVHCAMSTPQVIVGERSGHKMLIVMHQDRDCPMTDIVAKVGD